MKLIIREYLESLKERNELDAIMPDLLSELGFTVYSRPGRGTTQYGVDIAAVGLDEDGIKKVFLFSLKQGDLSRREWSSREQSLRPSLEEILDSYIPTRIPAQYKKLKVVICLCFGGNIQEQVQTSVRGFIKQQTTKRVSFQEWNGDVIAELLLKGLLREKLLPREMQSSFQKAVAMVDEPDISYLHFNELVISLRELAQQNDRARVRCARQIYICLWILYVWAREAKNSEAPYKISELAVLNVWSLFCPLIGRKDKKSKALGSVLHEIIKLHMNISMGYLQSKVFPHVGKLHGISLAVHSHNPVDINLKLFDLLGRIAMTGLWYKWFATRFGGEAAPEMLKKFTEITVHGFGLIKNNPALLTPICDQHAIDICLFLVLAASEQGSETAIARWLCEISTRIGFSYRTHGRYPCIFTNYRDLIEHPRANTDEHRKEATAGSILIPLIASWLVGLNEMDALEELSELCGKEMEHCTLQFWLPDSDSEAGMYIGQHGHGVAITEIKFSKTGEGLLDVLSEACKHEAAFHQLSAMRVGCWPIVLLACRHFRYPVPPQFWLDTVTDPQMTSN